VRLLFFYGRAQLGHVTVLRVWRQRVGDPYAEVVHRLAVPLQERLDGSRIAGQRPRFPVGILGQKPFCQLQRRGILAQVLFKLGQKPSVVIQIPGVADLEPQLPVVQPKQVRVIRLSCNLLLPSGPSKVSKSSLTGKDSNRTSDEMGGTGLKPVTSCV
jgi:hypothetical protein